jgi:hypothetical protein
MTIDPDVRGIAAHYNVDSKLIQAVVNAEGNIVRAVQCSYPEITTREEAIRIVCRSAIHAMSDYIKATRPRGRSSSAGRNAGRLPARRTIPRG